MEQYRLAFLRASITRRTLLSGSSSYATNDYFWGNMTDAADKWP